MLLNQEKFKRKKNFSHFSVLTIAVFTFSAIENSRKIWKSENSRRTSKPSELKRKKCISAWKSSIMRSFCHVIMMEKWEKHSSEMRGFAREFDLFLLFFLVFPGFSMRKWVRMGVIFRGLLLAEIRLIRMLMRKW